VIRASPSFRESAPPRPVRRPHRIPGLSPRSSSPCARSHPHDKKGKSCGPRACWWPPFLDVGCHALYRGSQAERRRKKEPSGRRLPGCPATRSGQRNEDEGLRGSRAVAAFAWHHGGVKRSPRQSRSRKLRYRCAVENAPDKRGFESSARVMFARARLGTPRGK